MDNITHSLFGAAVSETLWTFLPEKTKTQAQPKTRRALWMVSVLGNNLPDLDFLYAPLMHANPQLGNLLHHRGHTHTVPIALLQSLLMLGISRLFFKKDLKWISVLAFLAPLTHIALDYLNNYGVHPFWPIDNHWKYGDWVFVLEPWAWATLTPFLFLLAPSKKGKVLYASIALLGLILSWSLGVVPVLMCGVLSLWTISLLVGLLTLETRKKTVLTWSALAVILFVFDYSHRAVRKLLPSDSGNPILSPLPVNPFCWALVTAQSNGTHLHLRRAIVAPFPSIISLKTCTQLRFFSSELSSVEITSPILWEREYLISLSELRDLKNQFCDVQDFLRFARAPYYWRDETGLYFSDLRFERAKGRSFARIKISSQAPPCPDSRAPWIAPLDFIF